MSKAEDVFKAYDIRGIFPEEVNEELFLNIGRAFSIFIKNKSQKNTSVIVGRDMRKSSESLAAAFATGVREQGINAIDIGLASTDMCYFASGHFDFPAAMVTASHNPAEYNGLKICMNKARPVGEDSGLKEILEIVNTSPERQSVVGNIQEIDEYTDVFEDKAGAEAADFIHLDIQASGHAVSGVVHDMTLGFTSLDSNRAVDSSSFYGLTDPLSDSNDVTTAVKVNMSGIIHDNTWHHAALVRYYDSVILFVDGTPVISRVFS